MIYAKIQPQGILSSGEDRDHWVSTTYVFMEQGTSNEYLHVLMEGGASNEYLQHMFLWSKALLMSTYNMFL